MLLFNRQTSAITAAGVRACISGRHFHLKSGICYAFRCLCMPLLAPHVKRRLRFLYSALAGGPRYFIRRALAWRPVHTFFQFIQTFTTLLP